MAWFELEVVSNLTGYRRLLTEARAPGRRLWAIEGTGSYGAGLASLLTRAGERIVEIDRPKRPAKRDGAKTAWLDARRAAREALALERAPEPRRRDWREVLRVLTVSRRGAIEARSKALCALKALVVSAPEPLRAKLRDLSTNELLDRACHLRKAQGHDLEHRASVISLKALAKRIVYLSLEADELEAEIRPILESVAPDLTDTFGVGPISAAQLLISYSHHERFRSEAAFASLAGVAPIPASSGQVVRHRLNRSGDRQLNRTLHTIVLTRLAHDAETKAYVASRPSEGKSTREIRRCLARYVARQLYRQMRANPALALEAA